MASISLLMSSPTCAILLNSVREAGSSKQDRSGCYTGAITDLIEKLMLYTSAFANLLTVYRPILVGGGGLKGHQRNGDEPFLGGTRPNRLAIYPETPALEPSTSAGAVVSASAGISAGSLLMKPSSWTALPSSSSFSFATASSEIPWGLQFDVSINKYLIGQPQWKTASSSPAPFALSL